MALVARVDYFRFAQPRDRLQFLAVSPEKYRQAVQFSQLPESAFALFQISRDDFLAFSAFTELSRLDFFLGQLGQLRDAHKTAIEQGEPGLGSSNSFKAGRQ